MPNISIGPNTEYLVSGREYLLDREAGHVMRETVILDSSARDSSQTTLRKGLALGKIASTGKYRDYGSGNSDGSQTFRGFLDEESDLLNVVGTATDRPAPMVIFGRVNTPNTFGLSGSPITGLDGSTGCFFIWG